MPLCSVPGCKSSGESVSYFRFPRDIQTKIKWMLVIFGNIDFKQKDAKVCSAHFKADDFKNDLGANPLNLPQKKTLKESAVPSVNLPSHRHGAPFHSTVVTNANNPVTAPVGIIIYQYNIQDSNIQNSTIQGNNVQSFKNHLNDGNKTKTVSYRKIKSKIDDKLKQKIESLKADLRAEKNKCCLLQRKMAELKGKVTELQAATKEAVEQNWDEKIKKMLSCLPPKNQIGGGIEPPALVAMR